jgi:hypothetical protein
MSIYFSISPATVSCRSYFFIRSFNATLNFIFLLLFGFSCSLILSIKNAFRAKAMYRIYDELAHYIFHTLMPSVPCTLSSQIETRRNALGNPSTMRSQRLVLCVNTLKNSDDGRRCQKRLICNFKRNLCQHFLAYHSYFQSSTLHANMCPH